MVKKLSSDSQLLPSKVIFKAWATASVGGSEELCGNPKDLLYSSFHDNTDILEKSCVVPFSRHEHAHRS